MSVRRFGLGLSAVVVVFLILGSTFVVATEGTASDSARHGKAKIGNVVLRRHVQRGVFEGRWMAGNISGKLQGTYKVVHRGGLVVGLFRGVWTDGKRYGLLHGRIWHNTFKGIWYELPPVVASDEPGVHWANRTHVKPKLHHGYLYGFSRSIGDGGVFRGRWVDRTTGIDGVLFGKYRPSEEVKPPRNVGVFRGVWGYSNTTDITPAGGLRGIYGVNPSKGIGWFRGRWWTHDGDKVGIVKGICARGRFYGIWTAKGHIIGYVLGTYENGTFAGRWFMPCVQTDGISRLVSGWVQGTYASIGVDEEETQAEA